MDHDKNWQLVAGSEALFRVGFAMLDSYQSIKRARALLDFDDLIEHSVHLLTRSNIGQWVRYKLDYGIDPYFGG